MRSSRLERLITIMRLLQAGHAYHKEAMALECNVSLRTLQRDLNLLRAAGIPLIYDAECQGYRVHGARLLPASCFAIDEVLAILFMGREFASRLPHPCFDAARRAILKLEAVIPMRLLEQVRTSGELLRVSPLQTHPMDGSELVYETILQAQQERRVIRIEYRSLTEQKLLSMRLHPYCMFFGTRAWYIAGWSSAHGSVRTFHLGRIVNCQITDGTFQVPPRFTLEKYHGNAWRMIRCGPDQVVRLRFSSLVAQNVAEVRWHATQQMYLRPDGRLDFEVTVAGIDEILWWILGYGAEVEVLESPELRQKVFRHARRLVAMYEKTENENADEASDFFTVGN